jgi:phosphoribosyl 1,2-cyclic phosphodiesterase
MTEAVPRFQIRYWGVRGSVPTPGPGTVRYGGNTTCIEVLCDDTRIVIDSGTGIRELGNALNAAGETSVRMHVVYSHLHVDHIIGFPFFAPLYVKGTELDMYCPTNAGVSAQEFFRWQMGSPWLPVVLDDLPSTLRFHDVSAGEQLQIGGAQIRTCAINHPGGAMAIRIDFRGHAFVQCSDIEHGSDGPETNLVSLVRGADYLSYDSTYVEGEEYERHRGWGHSTWEAGVKVAEAGGVNTFIAFHHDPDHDDDFMDGIARDMAAARPGSLVAREGMILDLLNGTVSQG